jgi:hypothetical protein
MISQNLEVDGVQNFLFWDTESNHGEVTGKSEVNNEGS